MKIISWNTNGLRATAKQGNLMPLLKKYNPDILCLQETKCEASQLPENVRDIPGYYSYFSHSMERKGYSGVAIYTKEKPREVFYGIGVKSLDTEGRIIGIKLKKYTVITGYFPNGGQGPHRLKYKLEFYDAFLKFILKLRKNGENVIFCGDVNQDGIVDGSDMAAIDNASTNIILGYIPEDLNGDGIVDGSDMAIIDNNSINIVHIIKPY